MTQIGGILFHFIRKIQIVKILPTQDNIRGNWDYRCYGMVAKRSLRYGKKLWTLNL